MAWARKEEVRGARARELKEERTAWAARRGLSAAQAGLSAGFGGGGVAGDGGLARGQVRGGGIGDVHGGVGVGRVRVCQQQPVRPGSSFVTHYHSFAGPAWCCWPHLPALRRSRMSDGPVKGEADPSQIVWMAFAGCARGPRPPNPALFFHFAACVRQVYCGCNNVLR